MKNRNPLPGSPLPVAWMFLYVQLGRRTASVALLWLLGWQLNAQVVSDNFKDGNDTGPVAWTHVDSIFTASGGTSTPNTYDASTFEYHLTAAVTPDKTLYGPARTSSLPADNYTNFYVSVDVTAWDNTYVQPFGIVARVKDLGPATSDAYLFGYANAGALLGPGNSYITIIRMTDEFDFDDVPGSGPGADTLVKVELDPLKDYRFVFIGRGTYLEGRVYELPNLTAPIAVVVGNTAGMDYLYTEGQCGLLAYNAYSAGFGPFEGPVDVTFDNYYASPYCPLADALKVVDNFNDGNDTGWARYEPLAPFGAPGTYSFPGGNTYRIQAAASPDAASLGQGRAGSMWAQNSTDLYVSVDIVNWDDTLHQIVGLLVRASDVGLGTTKGYIWTHDRGNPAGTGGDMDMIILDAEAPGPDVPTTGADSLYMVPGKSYRFVFKGVGDQLRGEVFELPDLVRPVVSMAGTDATYASGTVGLLATDNSSAYDETADVTFDNFSSGLANPALSINGNSGSAVVTWPGNLACIWVLESSPTVGPGAVWTGVPLKDVVYTAGQNTYPAATPMAATGNTFYRLRKL